MISAVFDAIVYYPLYNSLVSLIAIIPTHDVGLAIIVLTILVKLLLSPVARQATLTQIEMKKIAPKLEELKKKYPNKEEQARNMLALYREHHIHPLSQLVPVFVQIPVILGLYWVFLYGHLPTINHALLYGFVPVPATVSMMLFGLIDLTQKNIALAVIAAASQAAYVWIAMPAPEVAPTKDGSPSFQNDLARSMSLQMRYLLPLVVGFIAYKTSAGVALYLAVTNIFGVLQERFVRSAIRDTQ